MELVFATAKEADSGGRDNEGDTHSAAGGSGNNNGIMAGVGDEDVVSFIMCCAGGTSDVDVVFEPFGK